MLLFNRRARDVFGLSLDLPSRKFSIVVGRVEFSEYSMTKKIEPFVCGVRLSMFLRGILGISVGLLSSCGVIAKHSRSFREFHSSSLESFSDVSDYQIGTTWGKQKVAKESLGSQSQVFQRAAKATARLIVGFEGATAFLLGEKDGEMLLATNRHVMKDQAGCNIARLSFEMLDINDVRCGSVINSSADLDLTIFTARGLSQDQIDKLSPVAKSFSALEPKKGMQLLTIGYGKGANFDQRNLMSEQSDDCKTFSPDGEVRFMADPDAYNPIEGRVWMFATGCDVSHGDSGSAFVDRETGDVIGILSTAKVPKNSVVRDPSFLTRIYDESTEDVWKELTYVVSSSKIVELLGSDLP